MREDTTRTWMVFIGVVVMARQPVRFIAQLSTKGNRVGGSPRVFGFSYVSTDDIPLARLFLTKKMKETALAGGWYP